MCICASTCNVHGNTHGSGAASTCNEAHVSGTGAHDDARTSGATSACNKASMSGTMSRAATTHNDTCVSWVVTARNTCVDAYTSGAVCKQLHTNQPATHVTR